MKAKTTFGVLLIAATTTVFAQEYVAPDANFVSTRTRAEVAQELVEANAAGASSVTVRDDNYPAVVNQAPLKTREQVRTELAEYNKQHPRGYLYSYYLGN